jgi:regulator of PEP synthase PpsR (kinase-PPPase family)
MEPKRVTVEQTVPDDGPAIFVVSDGRGSTCLKVVWAALVQFPNANCSIVMRPRVTTAEQARDVVREAAAVGGIIFFTLVAKEARESLTTSARGSLVPMVDVLGPPCGALRDLLQSDPTSIPGLLHESERERLDLMDAIDYTLSHDDGRRVHELDQAHVVLAGVSRVGKSVTSFYLAYQGFKVANVPLVLGVDPPPQLLELDPARVVGLMISPRRLRTVRAAREDTIGTSLPDYTSERAIARELRMSNELIEAHGWHRVDVSFQAIEEVAKEVIRLCGLGNGRLLGA